MIHAVVEPRFGIWRTINAAGTERMKVCLHGEVVVDFLLLVSSGSASNVVLLFAVCFFVRKQNAKSQTDRSLIYAPPVWGFFCGISF